ncbi:MAG: cellulase family glycosylhydrolase, partial [Bdellovibrionales bacterium]|nr:cellulase family glycosylhydrolase [Bdellovibrionales bacterium]
MHRREVLELLVSLATAGILGGSCPLAFAGQKPELPDASFQKLPRWYGFNLPNMKHFDGRRNPRWGFEDWQFDTLSTRGFNFVRLQLDYRYFINGRDPLDFNAEGLSHLDKALELGKKHGVHVNFSFYRAPGFSITGNGRDVALWKDDRVVEICAKHWAHIAERYKGERNIHLSFNLFNEPTWVTPERYR